MNKAHGSSLRGASAGFSVVELLVAVALSLLLLSGVVAMFASSSSSYETTDKLSRIQENGRFALDTIARHIRAAGFVGCARQPNYLSTSLNNANLLQWNFLDGPVRGFQAASAAWTPAIDASVVSPAAGNDVLVLRVPARDAEPMRLTADMAGPKADLVVPNVTTGVRTGDVALAYSCEGHSYFHVSSFSGGVIKHAVPTGTPPATEPSNANDSLSFTYNENAEVIPVETVIYYIRASSAASLPAGTTSLWRRVGLNSPEELVEGVERMELEFGVDTNADTRVDEYRTADLVTQWNNVFSVSVALLVRSLEEYGGETDQRAYKLLSVDVPAPADRRLREVFATTASLRNRVTVN